MLPDGEAIERKRFDLIEWERRGQATSVARSSAVSQSP
jgi:hypothetical protein